MKCFIFKRQVFPSSPSETMANLVAMSITAPVIVLKYHFSLKMSRLLSEMADGRSGAGNTQVEPGILCHMRQQGNLKIASVERTRTT